MEERVAYDIGDKRYIVGKPKGQLNGKYNFFDACVITEYQLPSSGKSLADKLKEVYLNTPDRGMRQIATEKVMSPQPTRFTIDVE